MPSISAIVFASFINTHTLSGHELVAGLTSPTTSLYYHIPLTDEEFFNLMLDDCRKVTRFKDKSNLTTWGGKIYKVETEGYMVIE